MSELLLIEQRWGRDDDAPWVVEGGRRVAGQEHNRRLAAVGAGLLRHGGVRRDAADADDALLERVLSALHDPDYLRTLRGVRSAEPVLLQGLAAPGIEPDIPVSAGLVAAAHESVRTAITAAQRLLAGERYTYALGRPPGHHAGPAWFGGYCYLNTCAAAARTLSEGGLRPVGILDLDLHYPNGTSVIVAPWPEVRLHSLHAWPVPHAPTSEVLPRTERERLVEFRAAPALGEYLGALAVSLDELTDTCAALVLSLGYDTLRGDPHGSWTFAPEDYAHVGRLVADSGLPVCVVQEGGYALAELAACSHAFVRGLLDGDAPPASAGGEGGP